MSKEEFDDDCHECRPVILRPGTLKPEPGDSPMMKIVNRVWEETGLPERKAFHSVTCLNSRTSEDLEHVRALSDRIAVALDQASLN
jgi:hypothetical protein